MCDTVGSDIRDVGKKKVDAGASELFASKITAFGVTAFPTSEIRLNSTLKFLNYELEGEKLERVFDSTFSELERSHCL